MHNCADIYEHVLEHNLSQTEKKLLLVQTFYSVYLFNQLAHILATFTVGTYPKRCSSVWEKYSFQCHLIAFILMAVFVSLI